MNGEKFSRKGLTERQQVARQVIEPLLKGKRDHTIKKVYDRIAPGPDGRSHTIISPVGTETFRSSSSESPLFEGHSTNWQNHPKKTTALSPEYKVRDCHIAPPGHLLLACDYAGAEAVLAAAYMKDWVWLDKLLAGADTHSEHARYFYNISLEEWDAGGGKDGKLFKPKRNTAKNVTYASLYMATEPTIQRTINRDEEITGLYVTLDEVTVCRRGLLQMHPLEEWWETTRKELDRSGGVTRNCFGYRRVFRDPDSHGRLKDALSNYPQSTVAWLINQSIVELYRRHKLLLQVHDELLFQVPEDKVETVAREVKGVMERPFKIHGRELFVPVEAAAGPHWGAMKKVA